MRSVETVAPVDEVIQDRCFILIPFLNIGHATLLTQPVADKTDQVYPPGVRRVRQGALLGDVPVVHQRMLISRYTVQHVIPNDHDRNAAWSDILLRTRVDQRIFFYIDRFGKNV
jgi:hypothetical protein